MEIGLCLVINGSFFFGSEAVDSGHVLLGLPEDPDGETHVELCNPVRVPAVAEDGQEVWTATGYTVVD